MVHNDGLAGPPREALRLAKLSWHVDAWCGRLFR